MVCRPCENKLPLPTKECTGPWMVPFSCAKDGSGWNNPFSLKVISAALVNGFDRGWSKHPHLCGMWKWRRIPSPFPIFVFILFSSQKEKYHTHLAVLYLDQVLKMRTSTEAVPRAQLDLGRSKLRHLLQESSLYRVQLILGKVKETDMYAECAILYGKLEEHDKALRILVHKLQDYGAAENYCVVNSKDQDLAYRRRLFQLLLSVYLDPMEGKKDSLLGPAMNLLNSPEADFDTVRVLQLLPENWSVGVISRFLANAVRASTHGSRMSRVQHTLSRSENLQLRGEVGAHGRCLIPMTEDRLCQVCQRPFSEPTFVRYPNGVVTHAQCARNKAVCPVTGRVFNTRKDSG
ncbi:transforming growth factor-beta receptor-associated protein 1-like [Diadema antillarum]|uniref:transforming growth factor-beta receptor-associated protein 1-like n=1 Tax=Diadema antillarum TaxID=105358 RepID=UPI003A89D82D